jgi:hypothetical protein
LVECPGSANLAPSHDCTALLCIACLHYSFVYGGHAAALLTVRCAWCAAGGEHTAHRTPHTAHLTPRAHLKHTDTPHTTTTASMQSSDRDTRSYGQSHRGRSRDRATERSTASHHAAAYDHRQQQHYSPQHGAWRQQHTVHSGYANDRHGGNRQPFVADTTPVNQLSSSSPPYSLDALVRKIADESVVVLHAYTTKLNEHVESHAHAISAVMERLVASEARCVALQVRADSSDTTAAGLRSSVKLLTISRGIDQSKIDALSARVDQLEGVLMMETQTNSKDQWESTLDSGKNYRVDVRRTCSPTRGGGGSYSPSMQDDSAPDFAGDEHTPGRDDP